MNILKNTTSKYYKKFIHNIRSLQNQTAQKLSYLEEITESTFNFILSLSCFLLSILFANSACFSKIPLPIFLISGTLFAFVHLSVHFWIKSMHPKYKDDFTITNTLFIIYSCFLEIFIFIPLAYSSNLFSFISKETPLIHFFLCSIIKVAILWTQKIHRELTQLHTKKILKNKSVPIVVVGNQETVEQFIQEILHSPSFAYDPQCILATDSPENYNICSSWSIPVLSVFDNAEIHKVIRTLPKKPLHIITTTSVQRSEASLQIRSVSQKYALPITQIILNFSHENFNKSVAA